MFVTSGSTTESIPCTQIIRLFSEVTSQYFHCLISPAIITRLLHLKRSRGGFLRLILCIGGGWISPKIKSNIKISTSCKKYSLLVRLPYGIVHHLMNPWLADQYKLPDLLVSTKFTHFLETSKKRFISYNVLGWVCYQNSPCSVRL